MMILTILNEQQLHDNHDDDCDDDKDKEGYQQDFMKRGAIEVAWFC